MRRPHRQANPLLRSISISNRYKGTAAMRSHLAVTTPPRAGAKLGLFHEKQDPQTLYAITIERAGQARRWAAGAGTRPIAVRPASGIPPGTPTVAVRLGQQSP